MEDNLRMVSYLRSGRCWWILRVYADETFDLLFSCTQPNHDEDVPRERYDFEDLEKVIRVGELKDWIAGIIGAN
jgi:hypothetical protein